MAREVYADPFGSYIQGYDTGAQRQMQQEQNVRAARDVDWNFYNMKPIELETAQRTNDFGAYADQYSRQMLPIGVDRARTSLFTDQFNAAMPLSYLGITHPANQAISHYTGMPWAQTPEGAQFRNPDGSPAGVPINPMLYNEVYPQMREEAEKRAQAKWQRDYMTGTQAIDANQSNLYGTSLALQAQGQANKGGNGWLTGYTPGAPMHNWLWGGGTQPAPTGQTVPNGNPYPGQYPTNPQQFLPPYLQPPRQ